MQRMAQIIDKDVKESPSCLDLRIAEKLKLTVEEQIVYRKLHWNEIMDRIRVFDEKMAQLNISLTEDEIADMVSKDRREHYEKSLGH